MLVMKRSGVFLKTRLAVIVVLLQFLRQLQIALSLIALSSVKLLELSLCLTLLCVRAMNALSRKIAGVTRRLLAAGKAISQHHLATKKGATISGM